MHTEMNFELPPDLTSHLASLDKFITETILPLQHQDDNNRFFDHRREYARTDWEQGGVPRKEWEDLLSELAFLFHFSILVVVIAVIIYVRSLSPPPA